MNLFLRVLIFQIVLSVFSFLGFYMLYRWCDSSFHKKAFYDASKFALGIALLCVFFNILYFGLNWVIGG